MSQENVEAARRGYEAFNRADLEGMVADFAPTFEYFTTGAIPGITGVYRAWTTSTADHCLIPERGGASDSGTASPLAISPC